MAALAAALLDELMGRNRNALPTERTKELTYNDAEVCRYNLVRFCPHDLFHNTKADLGPCPNIHDEVVRMKYINEAPPYTKTKFEDEFLKYCRSMLNEVERKIQKGEQRLAQSQISKQDGSNPKTKAEEQIALLTEKINHLVKEAERMGFEGNIDQAQQMLKMSDQFKSEREALKKGEGLSFATEMMLEKQMEVCKVCGAFLIVGDAPARLDDHMQGKQHVGYQKLRTAVEEITEAREKARQERELQRQKEMEDRRRRHDDDRRHPRDGKRRSKSRSPRRSHGERRDREKGDRHRSEYERRDKDRERDRHREHGHRDHRDRRRDDRPRDKDRERERHEGPKENGGSAGSH